MAGLLGMLQKAGNGLLSGIHTIDAGLMYGPNWRQIEDQQRTEFDQQKRLKEMQAQALQLQLAQAQKQAGNQQQLERIAPQIAGRMFGGMPYSAPGPTSGSPDGLNYAQPTAQYKADPQSALALAAANAPIGGLDVYKSAQGMNPIPFEQSDRFKEIQAQAAAARALEAARAKNDINLERMRLAGKGQSVDPNNPNPLNPRQQSGINMSRDAAISYAANLTGMTRDEIAAAYQTGGKDEVARLMREKGKRVLQGGLARGVSKLPIIGQTIVDMANSDLIAPVKGGGAGVAMQQNPTGPITGADFTAGEAQMPRPEYPLEVQADLVRQMLAQAEQSATQQMPTSPAAAAAPAAMPHLDAIDAELERRRRMGPR